MQPLMYISAGYALAFWPAFLIWIASILVRSGRRRPTNVAIRRDRGSLIVVVGTVFVGVFLGFELAWVLSGATITWQRPAVFVLGVVLMLLGIALRWWAVRTLGRFFTGYVAVQPDQVVVERGPYRFVRHPQYSGTLLTLLGLGLALTNWVSLAVVMLCGLAGHLYRVRVEEQVLGTELGRPYAEYMRRTHRFIPFVL